MIDQKEVAIQKIMALHGLDHDDAEALLDHLVEVKLGTGKG